MIDDKRVTFCIASCNRFDLLERTIDSFLRMNTYPIHKIIITEDSTNKEMQNKILQKYVHKIQFELIFNEQNLGPFRVFDNMLAKVETDYLFHSEDDWEFIANPNFMQNSIDILEERKDVHQIWIRDLKGVSGPNIVADYMEKEVLETKTGVKYKMLQQNHCGGWCGFSYNVGLRRKSDYIRMFPNGLSEFIDPTKHMVYTEFFCNQHAMKQGYRAASLLDTACITIGHGRTTLR